MAALPVQDVLLVVRRVRDYAYLFSAVHDQHVGPDNVGRRIALA